MSMNSQTREIMLILNEECAEIIVEICKCKRFGLHSKNLDEKLTHIEKLAKELGDMLAMVDLLLDQKLFTRDQLDQYKQEKIEKLKRYSNIKITNK